MTLEFPRHRSAEPLVVQDHGAMEPVPTYTEMDADPTGTVGLAARVAALREAFPQVAAATLAMPLTRHPGPSWVRRQRLLGAVGDRSASPASSPPAQCDSNAVVSPASSSSTEAEGEGLSSHELLDAFHAAHDLQTAVVTSFFVSVAARRNDVVEAFVAAGLVSPDCPDTAGQTPLLAAVRASDPHMVRTLLSLGADVNGFGLPGEADDGQNPEHGVPTRDTPDATPLRTPLMLAAQLGNLALVRFLVEDCGADDALVAPDGAIALRLAAEGRHADVVAYLPARRAGALRRWRVAHAREMRAARRAALAVRSVVVALCWRLPRLLLYKIPREVWTKRARIARFCARQVAELPGRVARAGRGLGKVAGKTGHALAKLPRLVGRATAAAWRAVLRLPGALAVVAAWLWRGVVGVARTAAAVGERLLSLLHTAAAAVADFFRTITLKDVRDGLLALLLAVAVELPRTLWSWIARFGAVTYESLGNLLGGVGKCLWHVGYAVWWLARWFPKKLWEILSAFSRSLQKGLSELLVWFDPKRV